MHCILSYRKICDVVKMKIYSYDSKFFQVKKLEASVLRIEQQLDEKDQLLYRVRMEARAKSRFLQKTIQVEDIFIFPSL